MPCVRPSLPSLSSLPIFSHSTPCSLDPLFPLFLLAPPFCHFSPPPPSPPSFHPSPVIKPPLSQPLCYTPFSPLRPSAIRLSLSYAPLLYAFLSLTPLCYTPFSPLRPSAIRLSLPYAPLLYAFLSLTPLGYTPFSTLLHSQTPLPSLPIPSSLPSRTPLSPPCPLSHPFVPPLSAPLPSLSFLPSPPSPIPKD
ncbi:unnamed protein product [Closterium sp. Yama58-4]|nr:unnamed protein product [Closterium sp. Yama58-4]